MDKYLKKYLIVIIAFCLLFSCKKEDIVIHVKELKFDNIEGSIYTGNKMKIATTILPEDATNKTITWLSEDEEVAIVEDGVISGIKAGTTNITATTKDGGITATYKITVTISAASVEITPTLTSIKVGNTLQMEATVLPIEATNKDIEWTISNERIATISEDGLLTAKSNGQVTISAKSLGGGKAGEYKITVTTPVKDLLITPNSGKIKVNEPIQLRPRVLPEEATNRTVRWSSSDNKIVSVSPIGIIKGISVGRATITGITEDGNKKATYEVEVTNFLYIPDENFRYALFSEHVDKDEDGEFTYEEVEEVNDLKINNKEIKDLTGIRAFKNLYTLLCKGNQIKTLDLSECKGITVVDCSENELTNLNVTGCNELINLTCKRNKLTSLDLSTCILIENITCEYNSLTSINISNCAKLTLIDCTGNQLSTIDFKACTELDTIDCDENKISGKLDFTTCNKAKDISCKNNFITSLEVTNCTLLESLICSSNSLRELILPVAIELRTLDYTKNPDISPVDTSNCPNIGKPKPSVKKQ